MKTSKRTYNFQLPYTVNGIEIMMGIGQLKEKGLFQKLPKDLQKDMEDADSMFGEAVITKKMCDEIDDETWTELAKMIGLKWKYADHKD